MRKLLAVLILPFLALSWTSAQAQIVLHVAPAIGAEPSCANAPTSLGCAWRQSNVDATAPVGVDVDVYAIALVQSIDAGFSEARFSINYNDTLGVGADILDWEACGDEVVTEPAWPLPGNLITIRFDPDNNCQGTHVDSAGTFGLAVLAVFRLHAYTSDGFQISGDQQENIHIADCEGFSGDVRVSLASAGEVGFGDAPFNDPCLYDYFSHACLAFPQAGCRCCMPDDTCRVIAFYFDDRNCRDAGGIPINGCNDCAVAVVPATWGSIKSRFQQ
jgi:hypothetical protein